MPIRFPALICRNATLAVIRRDFFTGIGLLDEQSDKIELNVSKSGRAELNWILDCEGGLYRLTSEGLLRASLMQRLGLSRRREKFAVAPPVAITPAELRALVASLQDDSPDFPNIEDLNHLLATLPPDLPLDRESFRGFFGE